MRLTKRGEVALFILAFTAIIFVSGVLEAWAR